MWLAALRTAERLLLLAEGTKFTATMLTSVDTQCLETRKFQIEEVVRALRVVPHMLYEFGHAIWSNSEEMDADFVAYSPLFWIKCCEAQIRQMNEKET